MKISQDVIEIQLYQSIHIGGAINLAIWLHKKLLYLSQSIHQTFLLFYTKSYFFLFYTPIFTKHPHQFIYSTHLFNKIFILLQFFIILSLTASLSQTQSASLSFSHQPNNNYNPPFHNKITTKHPKNIPFSLFQIFSRTKHFPKFSHKPNNSDL